MPKFGTTSLSKLETCHKDLQTIMHEAIKHFDFSVIHGYREPEYQFELYKKGRELKNGVWVVKDSSKIVTTKDGYKKLSKHNYDPSKAVDIAPYPIDWKNSRRFIYLGGIVMGIAFLFKQKGIIDNEITWGADWDNDRYIKDHTLIDFPHFQIK